MVVVGDPDGRLLGKGFLRPVVQVTAIRFQVDGTAFFKDVAVLFQVTGRGEAAVFLPFFEERVGEGDPNLIDLSFAEKLGDDFDAGTEEGGVGEPFLLGDRGALPDAGALDVDADEVAVGVLAGKVDGVLPPTAGEFQRNWVVITEVGPGPVAFAFACITAGADELGAAGVEILVDVRHLEDFGEFLEFVAGGQGLVFRG